MKTKIALAGLLTMALLLTSSVLARGHGRGRGRPDDAGPANRVTGGIESDAARGTAVTSFNAHEARANRPAKGMYHWQLVDSEGELLREIKVDVKYVKVEDKTAWFAGVCTYDSDDDRSRLDDWLFVKAYDGGTPARRGDKIWWQWLDADDDPEEKVEYGDDLDDDYEKVITAGNLVVHYYD